MVPETLAQAVGAEFFAMMFANADENQIAFADLSVCNRITFAWQSR
jgi:hypothetical protein